MAARARRAPSKARPTAGPAFEVDGSALPPLGMPPEEFLRDYWQKRPLLIRNAFPGFVSPIQPEDLAGLACEDAALSRIVMHDRARDAGVCEEEAPHHHAAHRVAEDAQVVQRVRRGDARGVDGDNDAVGLGHDRQQCIAQHHRGLDGLGSLREGIE